MEGEEEMRMSPLLRQRLEQAQGVQAQRLASLKQAGRGEGPAARIVADALAVSGMLLEGLEGDKGPEVSEEAVGYGSLVVICDLDTGEHTAYRIMSGDALDLDAGHISLESALGSALLGLSVGAEVQVRTPAGQRRVRIAGLQTLHSFLDEVTKETDHGATAKESGPSDLEKVGS